MTLKTRIAALLVLTALMATATAPGARAAELRYRRTVESYVVPDVLLVNENGKKVHLKSFLVSNEPVMVEFIYGTCTTICPILSAGFASLQRKLGTDSRHVRLVSITIDPENDTPKVMHEYLARYHAKPGWDFLSGSRADIDRVMRAFAAYVPDKMYHFPLTLIRYPKSGTWVRINGLMSSSELMAEYEAARSR